MRDPSMSWLDKTHICTIHAYYLLLFPIPFPYRRITNKLMTMTTLMTTTPPTKSSRLILQDSMMMDTTCLFDSRIDWWLLLIILLLLFVTLFPTRYMTGSPRSKISIQLLTTCYHDFDTPRQTILQDLHTITHYSATMTSMLQYSKVLFPSSQDCTALIFKAHLYIPLSLSILVLQGSLKAILV